MIKRENKIKMIVSDVDGTLLDSENKLSFKTRNILIEKKKHGKYIVPVTGRTLGCFQYAVSDFSFSKFVIVNHGAAIYDVEKGFFLWQDTFPAETAIEIFDAYKHKCAVFDVCSVHYVYRYSKKIELSSNTAIISVKDFSLLTDKNIAVCQIELHGVDEKDLLVIADEINEKYPLLETRVMQDSTSSKKWLSVLLKKVSKSSAVSKLQEMLSIQKEETLLFGDGVDDIEMLSHNGFGVAMGNALSAVKKASRDQTTSNDENGIVKWLDKNDV